MSTLLELTSQGDVGTMIDESKLSSIVLQTPQQLYELWERQNWQSQTIAFDKDRDDWLGMSDSSRRNLSWNLSSFFIGEERVATQFTGLVMAYEDQGEEAFLTTQQVDEVRHAQHFNNFYREVLSLDGSFEDRLTRAREDLTPAFVEMFDGELTRACQTLVENPRDIEAKIDYIVLYHMIIEGTLALTGQHFITQYCERRDIFPASSRGSA